MVEEWEPMELFRDSAVKIDLEVIGVEIDIRVFVNNKKFGRR